MSLVNHTKVLRDNLDKLLFLYKLKNMKMYKYVVNSYKLL